MPSACYKISNFLECNAVKVIITVVLYIRITNTSVAHNCRRRTRLYGRHSGITLAIIVLGMIASKLMPHLVANIIYIKRVAHRCKTTGYTARFTTIVTGAKQLSYSTASCTKNMPDIIISGTYYSINIILIFVEHSPSIIVGIRVTTSVGINDKIIVCNNVHLNR